MTIGSIGLRPFLKESQKISLFLLSFLKEEDEAVGGSSRDWTTVIGLEVRCEKTHMISFLLFLKFLFYPSNREENLKFRVDIFLGTDCPRKQGDVLELPRDERNSEKRKSSPSCWREVKVSLLVTSILFPLLWWSKRKEELTLQSNTLWLDEAIW